MSTHAVALTHLVEIYINFKGEICEKAQKKAIIPVLYVKLAETKTAADLLLQIMKGITQATGTVIPHLIN